MVQLVGDQPPAAVLLAHQRGRGYAHAVVVRGGRGQPAHGLDGRPRETGRVRRDEHDRDATVLGHIRIRAAGEPDPVRVLGVAGEDLLPVDDPGVAVAYGPGAQGGKVGTGLGLAVTNGEDELAGQDARQEVRPLRLGPVLHERGADRVERDHGDRGAGPVGLVEEHELFVRTTPLPPVLDGPAETEHPVGPDTAQQPPLCVLGDGPLGGRPLSVRALGGGPLSGRACMPTTAGHHIAEIGA